MFAGTGSLGFEALSRGANEVIFIEKQKSLCNSIEDIAKQLGIKKINVELLMQTQLRLILIT